MYSPCSPLRVEALSWPSDEPELRPGEELPCAGHDAAQSTYRAVDQLVYLVHHHIERGKKREEKKRKKEEK
jgi:hypothetical protein